MTMMSLYQISPRILAGTLTIAQVPLIVFGIAGIVIGRFVGERAGQRLNAEVFRKLVFAVLVFSGVLTIVQAIV